MPRLVCIALLALGSLLPTVARPTTAQSRPDIIFVVTDDMRSADWRALPQTQDLLADGTWLPNFIVTTALCCPSRASMLSGRYAHNHGVHDNGWKGGDEPGGWRAFRPLEEKALPMHLPDYDTALIGKYLNEYDTYVPVPGWDVMKTTALVYATDLERDQAVAFLGDGDPDPKFLWFAPHAPHKPASYPDRYADAFPDATGLDRDRLRSLLAVDEALAAMYAVAGPNTVWIVVSDNGYLLDEHGVMGKAEPYDTAHRIPALVRIPGVPEGTDTRIVTNVDLFATILTAAGYDVPNNDGRAWQDGSWHRDGILIEQFGNSAYTGIWTPRYTYLEGWKKTPVLWDRERRGEGPNALPNRSDALDWASWLDRLRACAGASCG